MEIFSGFGEIFEAVGALNEYVQQVRSTDPSLSGLEQMFADVNRIAQQQTGQLIALRRIVEETERNASEFIRAAQSKSIEAAKAEAELHKVQQKLHDETEDFEAKLNVEHSLRIAADQTVRRMSFAMSPSASPKPNSDAAVAQGEGAAVEDDAHSEGGDSDSGSMVEVAISADHVPSSDGGAKATATGGNNVQSLYLAALKTSPMQEVNPHARNLTSKMSHRSMSYRKGADEKREQMRGGFGRRKESYGGRWGFQLHHHKLGAEDFMGESFKGSVGPLGDQDSHVAESSSPRNLSPSGERARRDMVIAPENVSSRDSSMASDGARLHTKGRHLDKVRGRTTRNRVFGRRTSAAGGRWGYQMHHHKLSASTFFGDHVGSTTSTLSAVSHSTHKGVHTTHENEHLAKRKAMAKQHHGNR